MANCKPMNASLSLRMIEAKVDLAVKNGELSNKEARDILKDARYNYRNNTYNKMMERRGAFGN